MVYSHRKTKVALVILIASLFGCTKPQNPQKELRLFTWSEYFAEDVIRSFEKDAGIKVKVDYFSSNEQLLAKLQLTAGSKEESYDLILPSDYMVRTLIDLKLVQPIDKTQTPFLADFDRTKLAYDPEMKYSVPMALGTTGVAVNTKLLPRFATPEGRRAGFSWKEMMENPEFKGKVTLVDDTKEILQLGLMIHGKQIETATEADVKEAFAYLKAHKSQLKGFTSETRAVIEADECAVCMVFSGDAVSVSKIKPEIIFFVPKEGATLWTDNFAIPANARNPDLAYKFMARVLSAEDAKNFTERTGYRTPNLKSQKLLSKETLNNNIIFPTAADSKRFHYLVDRKDLNLLIDKEWALLKSQ